MGKVPEHIEQVQKLSKAYGADVIADLLGVSTRAMQKWSQDPSIKVRKETIRTLSELFVSHENGQNLLERARKGDLEGKYLESIERENKRLKRDLDFSLDELRHNSLLARAVAETNQELLIDLMAAVKKLTPKEQKDLSYKVGITNGEKYEIMRSEGRFADIGK